MIKIKYAESESELNGILSLQEKNLKENVCQKKAKSQGFVTVKHDLELLKKMNGYEKQIIAVNGKEVIGYALNMVKELKEDIPVLLPMFDMFSQINYNEKKLSNFNYYVMGQICIAEKYRGQGLFSRLYEKHEEAFSSRYDFCLTEVSESNMRSLRAHQKVGFETVHSFSDATDNWHILMWKWGSEL